MSRSNPSENVNPNPATRFFEWNGEQGVVRYYDKDAKKNVDVGSDFTFILLDQLGSVRGWHDNSDSGIYSNEVKDTRQEALVVKAFKGGTLIEGIYRDIKDKVNALGGQFVASCYIAFKNENGELQIGVIRIKGAALHAWTEFCKSHRADLYKKAVRINGYTEGKKGRITFRVPVLSLSEISPETDRLAIALDTTLQAFFKSYFSRTKREQVETHPEAHDETPAPAADENEGLGASEFHPVEGELTDDDIPF